MARNFFNLSRSPVLNTLKNKGFQKQLNRVGSIADPFLPGAKSASLLASGRPLKAAASAGGILGETGYNSVSRGLKTAQRAKGGLKKKVIASARGARTGLRKSAKDIANNISGGAIEAANAIPGANKIGQKINASGIARKTQKILNKPIVSLDRVPLKGASP